MLSVEIWQKNWRGESPRVALEPGAWVNRPVPPNSKVFFFLPGMINYWSAASGG